LWGRSASGTRVVGHEVVGRLPREAGQDADVPGGARLDSGIGDTVEAGAERQRLDERVELAARVERERRRIPHEGLGQVDQRQRLDHDLVAGPELGEPPRRPLLGLAVGRVSGPPDPEADDCLDVGEHPGRRRLCLHTALAHDLEPVAGHQASEGARASASRS
jgi:hypothetical protein